MRNIIDPEVVFKRMLDSLEEAKSVMNSEVVDTIIAEGVSNWREIVQPYFEASVHLERSIATLQSASTKKEGSTV